MGRIVLLLGGPFMRLPFCETLQSGCFRNQGCWALGYPELSTEEHDFRTYVLGLCAVIEAVLYCLRHPVHQLNFFHIVIRDDPRSRELMALKQICNLDVIVVLIKITIKALAFDVIGGI